MATEPVDLRRGHNGLYAIVRNQWRMDPFAGHLFAFVGCRGNRIKILFWDRGGSILTTNTRAGFLSASSRSTTASESTIAAASGRSRAASSSKVNSARAT